jgi:iron complex outermembrane receptor protein
MLVLVDGRSVYSALSQGSIGAGLQAVALEDIERIEVLRGSNSAAYGARAFLGTINIITRDLLDTQGGYAHVAMGDNGIQDAMVRLGGGDGRIRYRLSVDQRIDNGLKGTSGPDKVNRVNLHADLHPGGADRIELRAGQTVIDAGVGFANQDGNAVRTRTMDTGFAQLDWHRNLGLDQDLTFQVSHTQEKLRDIFAYVSVSAPVPGLMIDTSGRADNDNVSLQHTFRQGADLRVVWGGELRRESIVSKPTYNTDAAFVTDFARLFGNAEWRMHQDLILNAGGLFEKNNISGEHFAPRVTLNWHFDPGQTLRYGVSQAYRTPSVYEKYANVRFFDPGSGALLESTFVARGNVGVEKVLAREIGYLADFPRFGFNLDVRIFEEEVSDFIKRIDYDFPGAGLANTTGKTHDFVNDENFRTHGFEYQLRWQPWQGGRVIWSQSLVDSTQSVSDTIPPKPYSSASLMFMQRFASGLDFSLTYFQVDESQFPGVNQVAPAMSRTDLRLAWPLRFGAKRGELAFVVQNLGASYQDFLPEFTFRQQAYVMLRLDN